MSDIALNPSPLPPSSPQSFRSLPTPPVEKAITIRDLWIVLQQRKRVVFGTLLFFLAAASFLCVFSTRRYQAVGELQVGKENADAMGLENMMGGQGGGADALETNINIQTQAQILQSDDLALKVIKDLNLESNYDFRSRFNPLGWVLGLLSPSGPSDPHDVALEDAPVRRTRLLRVFSNNLKVKPVAGTRLIDVSYLNPDPKVAAAVVNHLIDGLADYNFETRSRATEQTSRWLSGQLSDLRKQSEGLQAKLIQLQRQSGVFSLGETDSQGREQTYTPVLDRLQQSTAQLSQAQSNRIMKGAVNEVVQNGDPEAISGLAGSGLSAGASTGVNNSLMLIQNLRAQEATAQGQYNELSAKFGPAYPKLAEVKANLQGIQASIQSEVKRIGQRARNDYQVAQRVEEGARTTFLTQKQQADTLNNKAIEYAIVRQEADQSRTLYDSLLKRLKEAGVLAGLRSSNITVVDMGRVPSRPAKPNVLLYLMGSLVGGLFLGSCAAIFSDTIDNRIRDLPELEASLGESPFGILPYHKQQKGELKKLVAVSEPRSPYTESLRALRTSLMLSRGGGTPPQVILVTSAISGEGKSMLSMNLAALLAQQKQPKRVLLIDSDLRRPVLHQRLAIPAEKGLSSILTSTEKLDEVALSTAKPLEGARGVDILTAGPIPSYPAELLGSDQMSEAIELWRQYYDFIIIDGAPVLPITDSILLSQLADLTLVVARYRKTERQSLERCCRLLESQGGGQGKIGIVLNAVERSTYHQYYGYKGSNYYASRAAHA